MLERGLGEMAILKGTLFRDLTVVTVIVKSRLIPSSEEQTEKVKNDLKK